MEIKTGYIYLHVNRKLVYMPQNYIEEDDPAFWGNNRHYVLQVWKFNKDDLDGMRRMYTDFKALQLKSDTVLEVSSCIGFDIKSLKAQ